MDTLPLPPGPSREQYRKRAKDLVRAANSSEPDAVQAWGSEWLTTLARVRGATVSPFVQGSFDRADALVAPPRESRSGPGTIGSRAPRDAAALRGRERRRGLPPTDAAERRVDREGAARGRRRGRCAREHLQRRTGTNDVEPARLECASRRGRPAAGAGRHAARFRRGDRRLGGRRLAADDRARVRHVAAAEALARRGARIDNVIAAAALGRVDRVRSLLAGDGGVSPSLVDLYWLGLSSDPSSHVGRAFVWACAYGRTAVVELLLAHGVDPAATDNHGMTGLDWATANGHVEVVELLTDRA